MKQDTYVNPCVVFSEIRVNLSGESSPIHFNVHYI